MSAYLENKTFSIPKKIRIFLNIHDSVKSVRIRSYSGPQFPAFGLNTKSYGVSLRIKSKCGKCGLFSSSACREKYLHFRCLVYAKCLHFHCLVYVTANFHCFLWVMRRGVRCPKRTFILFAAQASQVLSDSLCDLVPFVQFVKREVTLHHGYFPLF